MRENQAKNDGLTPPAELDTCWCIIRSQRRKSPLLNIPLCPKCFDDIHPWVTQLE